MSRLSQLYDLQLIDSGLDSRVARMRQIDEQMLDSAELLAARARLEEITAVLASEQSSLKKISRETEDTSTRMRSHEKRLYDGSIKNPKELGQVSEEVSHLKARLKELEDAVIERMMSAEASEKAAQEANDELERVESEHEQFKAGLTEEKEKLLGQARVLQVKRQRAITELPWADLQTYEKLRRGKGGLAVVTVRENLCGGCHVNVTANVLRQARTGTDLTNCPTCGRILYPMGEVKFTEFDHNMDNVDR